MILLLDTHLLLWAAYEPEKVPAPARSLIEDEANELVFSAASIWEVAITSSLGREDFTAHAAVVDLPPLHRDPFDRILVAQARVERVTLLTADDAVAAYGAPARRV